MGGTIDQSVRKLWALARRQHWVVARRQLIDLGFSRRWIERRIAIGRLHRLWRGVYAVGRPHVTHEGRCMAAVLACGPGAVLSHMSAAALWGIVPRIPALEVSVLTGARRRPEGITVHRRHGLASDEVTTCHSIPVTSPIRTLIDIAARVDREPLEAAINQADKLDLCDPERLRSALAEAAGQPGVRVLRTVLDRRTFTLTDSELERRFLRIVRDLGLPLPETGVYVNGFKVDFHWADLGLVVETDGLRFHRTPAQQARDRVRDQTHTAAGLTPLRFTRAQVRFEPAYVGETLAAVARRIGA
jgi:very-short-patch-repair endonuclease/predicted transcriptional regulator of viral defense system